MKRLLVYFANLSTGRMILWCYAIWYVVNVLMRFEWRPQLWLTSLGLSGIIGMALWISTRSSSLGTTKLDGWQVFRLYLMPFCVSSFAALVKDENYILVFPPSWAENLAGAGLMGGFLLVVMGLKRSPFGREARVNVETAVWPQKGAKHAARRSRKGRTTDSADYTDFSA